MLMNPYLIHSNFLMYFNKPRKQLTTNHLNLNYLLTYYNSNNSTRIVVLRTEHNFEFIWIFRENKMKPKAQIRY